MVRAWKDKHSCACACALPLKHRRLARRMWAASMRFEPSPSRHRATRRTKACRRPPCAASATSLFAAPLTHGRVEGVEDRSGREGWNSGTFHACERNALEFVFWNRYEHCPAFVCGKAGGGEGGMETRLVKVLSPSVCARQSRISVLHCALRLRAEKRHTPWSAAGIGGSRERAAGDAEPVGRNGG